MLDALPDVADVAAAPFATIESMLKAEALGRRELGRELGRERAEGATVAVAVAPRTGVSGDGD